MQIPADMHKWSSKFAWQMIGFAVVLFLMAGTMVYQAWFTRAKLFAHPQTLLIPTVGLLFGAVAVIWSAFTCISISRSTRRHSVRMKELEKNRPPLSLAKLREELQPEKQEQTRTAFTQVTPVLPWDEGLYGGQRGSISGQV